MTEASNTAPTIPSEYQRAKDLVDAIWRDGDLTTRTAVRKKAKELYPEIKLPEDEYEPYIAPLKAQNDALTAELKAMRDERAEEKKAREESKTKDDLEAALNSAKAKYNLTGEGFDKMVERMKSTGNFSDAEAAAAWVAGLNPPAPPSGPTWAPQSAAPTLNKLWGTEEGGDMWKLLHKDPSAYQDAVLSEFVSDPDKFVRDTFSQ